MRTIRGVVTTPPDSPSTIAALCIELRDTTYADGPAPVVVGVRQPDRVIGPNGRYPFELNAPDLPASSHLTLRCHIDVSGDGGVTRGDLLTTESIPVAPSGDVDVVVVPVAVV